MLPSKRYWYLIKRPGDLAVYATCVKCGYEYCCSVTKVKNNKFFTLPSKLHNYCPNCGKKYNTKYILAEQEYFDDAEGLETF